MNIKSLCCILVLGLLPCRQTLAAESAKADVVIYKACPSGIIAAVAAADSGAKVILLEPTAYVGGIMAQGGLCASDVGNYATIGGWSRLFFHLVEDYYRGAGGETSQAYKDSFIGDFGGGHLEPKVAQLIFEKLIADRPAIQLVRKAQIVSVNRKHSKIQSVDCNVDGKDETFEGKIFIDASYTGDLMALAKARFRVGTDGASEFDESLAPRNAGPAIQAYNYRVTLVRQQGESTAIPKPDDYEPNAYGWITHRVLSEPTPTLIDTVLWPRIWTLPNNKLDSNFGDMPGVSWDYPLGSSETRLQIERKQRNYTLGELYFIQNDPSLPESIHQDARQWGLPKDEYSDNSNFPREIYIREARRLQGEYIMKQSDLQLNRYKPDSIGLGSYTIDCHSTRLRVKKEDDDGSLGVPVRPYQIPYGALVPKETDCSNLIVPVCLSSTHVAWSSLRMEPVFMITGEAAGRAAALASSGGMAVQEVPIGVLQKQLADNKGLLDLPAEPIAEFDWEPKHPHPGDSVRLRAIPLQGASPTASWYWNYTGGTTVDSTDEVAQCKLPLEKSTLVTLVVKDAQGRSSLPVVHAVPIGAATIGDAQVDVEDKKSVKKVSVLGSNAKPPHYGQIYYHDNNSNKGQSRVEYTFPMLADGTYAVYISSTKTLRARDVKVIVDAKDGEHVQLVDENTGDDLYGLIHVGDYEFGGGKPPHITISNEGSHGYVVYDLVRCVLEKPAGTP